MQRFAPLEKPLTEQDLINMAVPPSTKRKASWANGIFDEWRMWKAKDHITIPPILEMGDTERNEILSNFIQEVRKESGEPYPAKSLMEIISSLQKYLQLNCVKAAFFNDPQYSKLQASLDVRMKQVTAEGIGLKVQQAQEIKFEDEDKQHS